MISASLPSLSPVDSITNKIGYCAPVDSANACKVIRGYTGIRLGNNVTNVEMVAYQAIERVMNEPLFLSQFVTMTFARIDFVRIVSNAVLQLPDEGRRGHATSKVAIAAAVVSFALTAIFLTGLMRKQRRNKARIKKQKKVEPPGTNNRFLLGSAPRKYYELDEDQQHCFGFKVLDIIEPFERVSATWSVSDITSESGSILSNLSKTTSSKLERIEEADDESQADDEWDSADTLDCDALPSDEYLYDLSSPRHHVDQWDVDVDMLDEGTEPQGCQYLDDSSDDEGYRVDCSGDDDGVADLDMESEEYLLASILDTSDDTVETSNETRAVLHASARNMEEIDDEFVQKWLLELVKELRRAQFRKLLTYPQE